MTTTTLTIGTGQNAPEGVSYASLEEAAEYLAADPRYSAAWSDANNKEQLLVYATRLVNAHDYAEPPNEAARQESLEFPKGDEVKVPDRVVHATILEAGFLAATPPPASPASRASAASTGSAQLRRIGGDGSIEWFPLRALPEAAPGVQSPDALELLRPYFADQADGVGCPRVFLRDEAEEEYERTLA